jgi:serine/threonine protein kinase
MKALPDRLGRYQILGELAVGGMAEILLARVVGPRGFERPVVIKRILPHLARQDSFVSMFLDEARIAAGIRHKNVIHVEELADGPEGLYFVMEYLEGESAAGLMRRLFVREASLDFALGCYIVAEACAGLHAAHELEDAAGQKQHLVHRDVSPHNIFVTYDGGIKVLDFGIAKAADRITQTEAGQLKGKFSYMSPEQCRGQPLDRRSDIFALGLVLYELTTSRRVFKADNAAQTIQAICDHLVVPPTRLSAAYPAALETVCMRALAAAPEDRYPTALDMRRDLLAVGRGLAPTQEVNEGLATLMRQLFEDRVAEKRELLRRLRTGSNVTHVPAGETDRGVELAPVPPELATEVQSSSSLLSGTSSALGHPRPRKTGIVAGAVVVAAVAAGAIVLVSRPSAHLPSPATSSITSAAAPLPAPSASGEAMTAPSQAAAPQDVVVRVETRPSGAIVSIDGNDMGATPVDLRLPQGTQRVPIALRRPGFASTGDTIVPDRDQTLRLDLAPGPAAARPTPTARPALAPSSPWVKWH